MPVIKHGESMWVCRCFGICHGKTQELDLHDGKGPSKYGGYCTGGQVEAMQYLTLVSNFAQEPVNNNTFYPISIEWIRIVSACTGLFNHKSVPHGVHCDLNWQVISVQDVWQLQDGHSWEHAHSKVSV